ncbi:hypothetical protein QFZ67_002503 [Streptomyces sp. V1I1]|nr:hypothetical protein [Streptomyces sp. V1I1]MDQ0940798.1 hypothetical protein [Streptomyces sp. V1I1]
MREHDAAAVGGDVESLGVGAVVEREFVDFGVELDPDDAGHVHQVAQPGRCLGIVRVEDGVTEEASGVLCELGEQQGVSGAGVGADGEQMRDTGGGDAAPVHDLDEAAGGAVRDGEVGPAPKMAMGVDDSPVVDDAHGSSPSPSSRMALPPAIRAVSASGRPRVSSW